jgi:hypothetical protein
LFSDRFDCSQSFGFWWTWWTETAMGRHVDAQLNNDSEYVKAVCTWVMKLLHF